MHARTQIREIIVDAITGLTTTEDRVYVSHVYPVEPSNLPCILLNVENERVGFFTFGAGTQYIRSLSVKIRGLAQATSGIYDTLDQIASEIEIAIYDAFQPCTTNAKLLGITTQADDGESLFGEIILHYEFDYIVPGGNPNYELT